MDVSKLTEHQIETELKRRWSDTLYERCIHDPVMHGVLLDVARRYGLSIIEDEQNLGVLRVLAVSLDQPHVGCYQVRFADAARRGDGNSGPVYARLALTIVLAHSDLLDDLINVTLET